MEIIDKLMKIEDDEQFCIAEYDAVQDYCYKKDFHLSKEERKIILCFWKKRANCRTTNHPATPQTDDLGAGAAWCPFPYT